MPGLLVRFARAKEFSRHSNLPGEIRAAMIHPAIGQALLNGRALGSFKRRALSNA
jgi:hypothetical protein